MSLADDQHAIQELATQGSSRAFADRVHSRCLTGGADDPDPGRLEHGTGRLRDAGVPVMQDELRSCPGIPEVHGKVPGPAGRPRIGPGAP